MNIPTGGIIALIVIVLHIVAALSRHVEKKKREEAARRAMQNRRPQEQGIGVGLPNSGSTAGNIIQPPSAGMGGATITPSPPKPPGVDTVAMRRAAQLEQLRQRRDVRRASSIGRPQEPVAAPSGRGPMSPSQTVPEMRQGMRVEDASQPQTVLRDAQSARQREVRNRQKAQELQNGLEHEQRTRVRRQAEDVKEAALKKSGEDRAAEVAHRAEKIASRGLELNTKAKIAPLDPYYIPPDGDFVSALNMQLRRPVVLRQMFVIKEILDSPVSLR